MSDGSFDRSSPELVPDHPVASVTGAEIPQASQEQSASQHDPIEVENHSHPSRHASVSDDVNVDSIILPIQELPATSSHETQSGVHPQNPSTKQVAQQSSSLSSSLPSSLSSSNDNTNENNLNTMPDPNPTANLSQSKTTLAPASASASTPAGPTPQGFYSTIKMTLANQTVDASDSHGAAGRGMKQYQLDDGSVVSGKGLGRGRPGVKRGPRSSSGTSTPVFASNSSSGTPVAAPHLLTKRRRTTSKQSGIKIENPDSDSDLSESRASTPEYNPTDETRSGRKIQKPPVVQAIVSESASPASKRPKLEGRPTGMNVSPSVKSHPKIKRRMYRGREQLALCEHCQRGHGPHGNVIVFCDACNKCWHQRCHQPQVPQAIISDSKAEWFCSNCDKILRGKKGKKGKINDATATQIQPALPQFVGPLVGGAALTQAHKIVFLESRTREQLISLILQGSDLAPALPMFQAPAPQLPQAQFKSNYTTPISSTPGLHTAATAADAEDEGYDSYFDDHVALYPKPGQGINLPPDAVDLHMLLEHTHSRTFSHWIRGMPTREYSGNADIVFQR